MNKFMKRLAKNEGFTLVELIVVIAILAILAGVATAGYAGYIQNANDAAVLSDMDAILTAATAANAVNGEIDEVSINVTGDKVTITVADDATLALDFVSSFKLYYGTGTGTITDADKDGVADEDTVVITIDKIDGWDASKYGKAEGNGAVWTGEKWVTASEATEETTAPSESNAG